MKKVLVALILLISVTSTAQQLRLKKGEIYNSKMEKLDVRQVKFLLKDRPDLLQKYNAYRQKSIWGGFLLGAGAGLLTADVVVALTTDTRKSPAAMYIGGSLMVASIPILIGRKNKIESVVEEYNNGLKTTQTGFTVDEVYVLANQYGAGVRITF